MPLPMLLLGAGGILVVVLIVIGLVGARQGGDVDERLDRFVGRTEEKAKAKEAKEGRRRGRGGGTSALAGRLDQAMADRGFAGRLAKDLAQANYKLTVAEFLALRFISGIAGLGLGYLVATIRGWAPAFMAFLGFVIGMFVPSIMMRRAKGQRLKKFNDQLGDTITLLANSLRSGYSLLQSMEMVSRESPPPVSEEFRRVVQEVGLGFSTQDALANLLRRVPSDDLDLMITAINIQHEVGGNLAQILDTIGHTIRERIRIKGEIRVLVSQQRISGFVVAGIPFALGVILTFITPDFMLPLFSIGLPWPLAAPQDAGWICMPACAFMLMIIGFVIIQKIVNIEV
ncbi:MAG: type II secretion system F family protein [Chloroflexia bacterium]|nr:type II secretion system F family protein [Chloroflexia bacterium]